MKRILLVDDTKSVHDIFDTIFIEDNVEITHRMDPFGSLGILSTETFDLIVLDYQMPGMNGLELLKLLRQHKVNTTVAFFSGYLPEGVQQEAKNLNVTLFFNKPPENTLEFRNSILKACGEKH